MHHRMHTCFACYTFGNSLRFILLLVIVIVIVVVFIFFIIVFIVFIVFFIVFFLFFLFFLFVVAWREKAMMVFAFFSFVRVQIEILAT